MKFDLASDLHVDFYSPMHWDELKTPDVDTLIIAGDASNNIEEVANVMYEAKKHYKNVAYVDGNHDHYNCNIPKSDYKSVSENMNYLFSMATADNWTYLPFRDLRLDDTVFIGNNGWYDWNAGDKRYTKEHYRNAWINYISDSRLVKFNKEPDILAEKFALELYDKVQIYAADPTVKNIVIVTHTLPIHSALVTKTENSLNDVAWNQLNGCFYNSHMDNVHMNNKSRKIKYWVFGHTHFPKHIESNGIKFVCNPKGYPTELASHGYRFRTLDL